MRLFNHTVDCYNSIYTLPIYNWWMGHKENDVSYLMVNRKQPSTKQSDRLQKIWIKIYDEYIERYGFNQEVLDILHKRIEIAKLKIQRAKGSRTASTDIEIAEFDLQNMINAMHKEENFLASKPIIEHVLGFQIDIKTTSVAEYMDYGETAKQIANKKAAA